MLRAHQASALSQRGAAALVVVMVLFFIMSLVAAYASRNLIFEQRTSANNYRSTQAFDAAEAGLEWAVAMLNGGRIDAACASTADPARNSFRERYLNINADGSITVRNWVDAGADSPLLPSCVRGNTGWVCSCPEAGVPVLAAPAGVNSTPTFSVSFVTDAALGVVRVFSKGCSNFGAQCLAGAGSNADAEAEVNAVLGLAPALAQTPGAAITVRGLFTALNADIVNPDTVGIAVHAGDVLEPLRVTGPAGMSATSAKNRLVVPDPSLRDLAQAGGMSRGDMMFLATFGVSPAAYRVQPAVVRLSCGADCAEALSDAVARFPARVIWIDPDPISNPNGDLTFAANTLLDLGSAAVPLMLVVGGNVVGGNVVGGNINIGAGSSVVLRGALYVRGKSWSSVGAEVTLIGALIAEGDPAIGLPDEGRFTIDGDPRLVYDAATMDHLEKVRTRRVFDFGSFARLPGSWRDFR